MNRLSRHELKYLSLLSQRIGWNLSKLRGGGFYTTATRISQTVVHGSPLTPNQPGGVLNISANDFKLLVSAGVVSPSVRVPHSRGEYYTDLLFAELEHFAGVNSGAH